MNPNPQNQFVVEPPVKLSTDGAWIMVVKYSGVSMAVGFLIGAHLTPGVATSKGAREQDAFLLHKLYVQNIILNERVHFLRNPKLKPHYLSPKEIDDSADILYRADLR